MLPDQQREVIALNHYALLSLKEIAGIMKCSITTALDTMKYGLHNLRKLMNEKEIAFQKGNLSVPSLHCRKLHRNRFFQNYFLKLFFFR